MDFTASPPVQCYMSHSEQATSRCGVCHASLRGRGFRLRIMPCLTALISLAGVLSHGLHEGFLRCLHVAMLQPSDSSPCLRGDAPSLPETPQHVLLVQLSVQLSQGIEISGVLHSNRLSACSKSNKAKHPLPKSVFLVCAQGCACGVQRMDMKTKV